MKTQTIAFSAASVLVFGLIIIGTFKTGIVSALTATTTDATSTASDTTTTSSAPRQLAAQRLQPTQAQHPLFRPPKPKRRIKVRHNPRRAASPHSNSSTSLTRNMSTTSRTARRRTPTQATRTLMATSISPTPRSPLMQVSRGSPPAAWKPTIRPAAISNPAITRKKPTAHTSAMSRPTPTQTQPPASLSRRTLRPRKPTQPQQPNNYRPLLPAG